MIRNQTYSIILETHYQSQTHISPGPHQCGIFNTKNPCILKVYIKVFFNQTLNVILYTIIQYIMLQYKQLPQIRSTKILK